MFYAHHTLKDPTTYFLKPPTKEEFLDLLKKNPNQPALSGICQDLLKGSIEMSNPIWVVQFFNQDISAIISLQVTLNSKDNRKYPLINYKMNLGIITISTVNHNCGAIHISGLISSVKKIGIGSLLLANVEHWSKQAGYTMLYGNIAGIAQEPFRPFFEKRGYTPMGTPYKNIRSGNINYWFQKVIATSTPESEDNNDEDED